GRQLYQRDLADGITSLVSANRANTDGADNTTESDIALNHNFDPFVISADGRFVGFRSVADNLVANDYNLQSDVYVRDMQLQNTDPASARSPDLPNLFGPDGTSFAESISADGRFLAFQSDRPDLLPTFLPLINGCCLGTHAFVRDLQSGTDTLV